MSLQSVGVREFRAHLHKYTRQNDETIAITSHGETIGYYVPARPTPQAQHLIALEQAVQQLTDILEASGVSAEDILTDFRAARQKK